MRNKANFNIAKLTVTSRSTVNYNNFHPKTKNGTKPITCRSEDGNPILAPCTVGGFPCFARSTQEKNKKMKSKPNFKTPHPNFSEELFSDTRLRQWSTGGVQVYVEDWTAAVQRRSRTKKPLKSPRGAKIKNTKSKPNLSCQFKIYNSKFKTKN